jgi:hypothetical protein
VGARCPDCAKVNRLPTYNLPTHVFLRAGGAALGAGLAVGVAWAFFNIITYIFWGVLAGIGIGYAIGEIVSVATNRKAGPPLQFIAAGGVIVAFLTRVAALVLVGDWVFEDVRTDIFGLLVTVLAAFVAAGRLR